MTTRPSVSHEPRLSIMAAQEEDTEREYSSAELMAAINDGNRAITHKIEELNSTLKALQQKTTFIEKKREDLENGLKRIDGDVEVTWEV